MTLKADIFFRALNALADITVQTVADMHGIKVYRRKWGMQVFVFDDGEDSGMYVLEQKENDKADNTNWERQTGMRHYFDREIDNDFGRDGDLIFNPIRYFDYTYDETFE